MGRADNWGLPVRLARMLHEVQGVRAPARIEVRSGTGSNARYTPTSNHDGNGHVVLTRDLAHAGHYPAVDVLASVSRLMNDIVSPSVRAAAQQLRSALGKTRGQALRVALVLEFLWWCGADGFGPPPAQISAQVGSDKQNHSPICFRPSIKAALKVFRGVSIISIPPQTGRARRE